MRHGAVRCAGKVGLTFVVLLGATVTLAGAQENFGTEGDAFKVAYEAEVRAAGFTPSPLALKLALAAGQSAWRELQAVDAARYAYAYAYRAERALRFGESAQAVASQLRQRMRLETRSRDGGEAERLALALELRTRTRSELGLCERAGKGSVSGRYEGGSGRRH